MTPLKLLAQAQKHINIAHGVSSYDQAVNEFNELVARTDFSALHAHVERMREFIKRVEAWELPVSGKFYDKEKTRPAPYDSVMAYGSNGGRDYWRKEARAILEEIDGN